MASLHPILILSQDGRGIGYRIILSPASLQQHGTLLESPIRFGLLATRPTIELASNGSEPLLAEVVPNNVFGNSNLCSITGRGFAEVLSSLVKIDPATTVKLNLMDAQKEGDNFRWVLAC